MNKKIIYILLIIIVLTFIGVGMYRSSYEKGSTAINTIKVADPNAIGGALFHIAEENNYFEQQGLHVEVVTVQTGDESIKALLSNSVDVALGGLIPYSFIALDNQHMKIIATNAYAYDNQVIANKSRDITKAEDLKGKKIAYTKTTASDIGIKQFLKAHNMTTDDVQLIDMKPLAMAGALASGQVDAYTSWEPAILNGQKLLGDKTIVFTGPQDVYTWHQSILAQDTYIQSHKETLAKFISALQQAEQFSKDHPTEAIALSAKHNKIPVDVLTAIWPKYELSIQLGDDLPEIISTDLEWANNQRTTKVSTLPTPEQLIDRSVLEYVSKK